MNLVAASVNREMLLRRQLVGPAEILLPWLLDPGVTDILINGAEGIYVEKGGCLQSAPWPYGGLPTVHSIIERMIVPLGKQIDASKPYLDGRLSDGTRFHIILPPLASPGPCICLRKPRDLQAVSLTDIAGPKLLEWFYEQVKEGCNLLIAGATGAGKTTLLGLLVDLVPEGERVITIEETREIVTEHTHVVRLEARTPSPDGAGGVSQRELLRNALRMRPDRLLLGECRSAEAFDLLQAMASGHHGVMGTLHADNASGALRRLESLALLAGTGATAETLREWISTSVHAVVCVGRRRGLRRVTSVTEIKGLEGTSYRMLPRPDLIESSYLLGITL